MRGILVFFALVIASGAIAASFTPLTTNRIGCQNPQDLIDFMRQLKQTQGNDQLSAFVFSGFMAKVNNGVCHQFTQGTPVTLERREKVQDTALVCIRDEREKECFYSLDNND